MWLGCDTEMKTNTLKVGDKVKVIKTVEIGGFSLLGFTGTIETVFFDYRTDPDTGKPTPNAVEAYLVDFGFERMPDFFFLDELELIQ